MRRLLFVTIAACCPMEAAPVQPKPTPVPTPVPTPTPVPQPSGPQPPVAKQVPFEIKSPHGTRVDPYFWIRDDTRKDPAVLALLEEENKYTREVLAPVNPLEDQLVDEMRARVKEDDASVPRFDNGYWYYTRFEVGSQYPIYARRKGTMQAAEQIVLDGNALSQGHSFFAIGGLDISRDGKLVAYAEDTVGRRQYVLRVREIATGKVLPETAENIATTLAWANDNKTLFYVGKDPTTLRSDRVIRVTLGGKTEQIFDEKDTQYDIDVRPTKSHKYIEIELDATTSTEVQLIDAAAPTKPLRVLSPRKKDHLYSADHLDGRWVIRTNQNARNFRVVEAPESKPDAWKDILPHRDDVLVEDVALYRDFIAVSIRSGGLRKVQVMPKAGASFVVDAPDATYAMTTVDTPDPAAKKVRLSYDAPTRPNSILELDVKTKQREVLKEQPVPTYDQTQYASEYLHASAQDGTQVPISVVYKKTTKLDGSAPLLVYGYGSYGYSMEPRFDANRVSLLDRGFVYAVIHVRGGQEMGRAWYEDGRLMKKTNTFTDFIAGTEYLVKNKYGAAGHVFALGGSAGGLLMGAIANMRPDLYRGILAIVPFVDVVTTMLDASIPLTTGEYDEWGNPADKAAYDYMLAYSPYDNIKAQAYPAIYCKTGLWDSQVQYYEPTKWVEKLRATKTNKNPVLLDIDMSAGHGGASGRFDKLRDTAREYAFILFVNDLPTK